MISPSEKVLIIIDGLWFSSLVEVVSSPRNSNPFENWLGPGWELSHRIDYHLISSIIDKEVTHKGENRAMNVMKTIVLIDGPTDEYIRPTVHDMKVNGITAFSLYDSDSIPSIGALDDSVRNVCMVTGSAPFLSKMTGDLKRKVKYSLVSVRKNCDPSLLNEALQTSSTVWLEDHLKDFVTPFPFVKVMPIIKKASLAIAGLKPDLALIYKQVLGLICDYLRSCHPPVVSSRTIGRILSHRHSNLLEALKTKLGGLKSMLQK
jgi:hypothetical protein